MENPFDNPTTIRKPESFIGRDDILSRAFGMLKDRQNISLVGPKRIGKTSLLTCLRNEEMQKRFAFAGETFRFFYLDLQGRSMKMHQDLFIDLNRLLREQSQDFNTDDAFDRSDEFSALLEHFQQHGQHPVLMIDTFDEIARYKTLDVNVFDVLRSTGTSGQISYITASLEPLSSILSKLPTVSKLISPFATIFGHLRLKPFSRAEATHLLSSFSQREGLPFTEEEITWILEMAGEHPYLLQQIAAVLFEEKRAQRAETLDFPLMQREGLQNVLGHFEDCYQMLTLAEREALLAHIQTGDGGGRIYPELCASRLFQEYLRATNDVQTPGASQEASTPQASGMAQATHSSQESIKEEMEDDFDLTVKSFVKILDKFGDTKFLGKSEFISLPYIAAQISLQNAGLSVARGKIMQQVILEALDGLKGEEPRSDSAPDWQDYNILYDIIKRDMKRKTIAIHMGVSERQLYRYQKRAAERLLGVILTMQAGKEPAPIVEGKKQ